MADGIKTGRRASKEERAAALKWVDLYRLAEQSPDRQYCVNPADPPDARTFVCANDPELLLIALRDFADHGTFQAIDPIGIKRLVLRAEFATHIETGKRREDALELLADRKSVV